MVHEHDTAPPLTRWCGAEHPSDRPGGTPSVNLLLAPLRPLADVLDLTAEAVAALGTVSVAALSLTLQRPDDDGSRRPQLRVVEGGQLS